MTQASNACDKAASLNTDTGKYDLASSDAAVRHASWALYWLSDALWLGQLGGKADYVKEYAKQANAMALSAIESVRFPTVFAADASVVGCIESILKGN